MPSKISHDIVVYKENKLGIDYVIGDVHGSSTSLKLVIDSLNKHDRLFIVGDLFDRGISSEEVLSLVIAEQDRVFTVRGNHEIDCLMIIQILEELMILDEENFIANLYILLAQVPLTVDDSLVEKYDEIAECCGKSRAWLIDLFLRDWLEGNIYITESTVKYQMTSEIRTLKYYIESLPYIIYVDGAKPFKIVHADMPFEDKDLFIRIASTKKLTKTEKDYAVYARLASLHPQESRSIELTKRDENAIITYVGHSQLANPAEPIIRFESNTINVDSCAYYTKVFLVINHTEATASFIGTNSDNTIKTLSQKLSQLMNYFAIYPNKIHSSKPNPITINNPIWGFSRITLFSNQQPSLITPTNNPATLNMEPA